MKTPTIVKFNIARPVYLDEVWVKSVNGYNLQRNATHVLVGDVDERFLMSTPVQLEDYTLYDALYYYFYIPSEEEWTEFAIEYEENETVSIHKKGIDIEIANARLIDFENAVIPKEIKERTARELLNKKYFKFAIWFRNKHTRKN